MKRMFNGFGKIAEKWGDMKAAGSILLLQAVRGVSPTADRALNRLEAEENQRRLAALARFNAPRMGPMTKDEIFGIPTHVTGANGELIPVKVVKADAKDLPKP